MLSRSLLIFTFFFFNDTATTEIYTLSLHDALPICPDERQALLAQAVVSRSFALKNRGRWEAQGFDAWADVRDQVYNGVAGETPDVWEAVRRTTGQALTYDGEIIDAYFHSTCGSSTAGVEEVFETAKARPYLRPVSDASGGGRYYCEIAPRFRW